jgi:hypothetical protein
MQGRKFQLKTNIYANFQDNTDYEDVEDVGFWWNDPFMVNALCHHSCSLHTQICVRPPPPHTHTHTHTSCEPLLKTLKISLVLRHFSLALSVQSQHDIPHSAPLTATNKTMSSLSICHISCSNVKLSVTHAQLAPGESVMLASQLSQHNPTTGLLLKNVSIGNECPGKLDILALSVKVTMWRSLWLMLQSGLVGKQPPVGESIMKQICLASTTGQYYR